jgi:hypothetical protein
MNAAIVTEQRNLRSVFFVPHEIADGQRTDLERESLPINRRRSDFRLSDPIERQLAISPVDNHQVMTGSDRQIHLVTLIQLS